MFGLSATAAVFTPSNNPLNPLPSSSSATTANTGASTSGQASQGEETSCGVQDWPEHKAECKLLAEMARDPAASASSSPSTSASQPKTPNFMGQKIPIQTVRNPEDFFNVFPKDLPKKEAYGRVIDCFRLWCDDARRHLPSWWTDADTKATIKMSKTDEHYSVEFAQEKSDINEHYGNPSMAMIMRMWTEQVTGMRIGGFGGFWGRQNGEKG
ncbi:hypothetical protein JCM11251_004778 [Rhodosporidiobolus azoricus]